MNYLKIDKEDVCNGEGLRVVLWLSGCSHHCYNCQNTQTWNANSGIPFDNVAKEELFRELDKDYISGLTLSGGDPLFEGNLDDVLNLVTEVNGRYNIPQHIDKKTNNNYNILNKNDDEIRLSCPHKNIWLYTGYTIEELDIFNPILDFVSDKCNLQDCTGKVYENYIRQQIVSQCNVLVDGKYIDSQRDISLPYRGSKNQRLIDIKKSLRNGETVLWEC